MRGGVHCADLVGLGRTRIEQRQAIASRRDRFAACGEPFGTLGVSRRRAMLEEAAILDEHRYADWIELFTDDTHYFMPIRRTRTRRELDKEFTKPGEMAYFDDDKMLLNGRVLKFLSGTSWAEDPPSRTRHMIHNVRIIADRGDELDVEANFHIYRTRLKSEEDAWVGKRAKVSFGD